MHFKKRSQEIDFNNLPKHIAFIMDGNGRWAKKRGMPRLVGHNAGTETLKRIVKESKKIGIGYITFYAFSTENWKRPSDEVNGLMNILVKYIQYAKQQVEYALDLTKDNHSMQFNIALNYGSRDEMIMAIKKIAENCVSGDLNINDIDEEMVSSYLYTAGMPDPDLLIRTSGEFRLSNFLLWQVAYTEFKFETIYWPDFNELALQKAIIEYQNRNRRYGAI